MNNTNALNSNGLSCPLCGNQEYLISDSNKMICGGCGTFFDDLKQVVAALPSTQMSHTYIHCNNSLLTN